MDQKEERTWGIFISIAGVVGQIFFSTVGSLLAPLVLWLIKRNESSWLDRIGKEALNFQITVAIVNVIIGFITAVRYGLWSMNALLWHHYDGPIWSIGLFSGNHNIVWILNVIFSIIAAVKANRGEIYRYPLSWRVVK